MPALAVFEDGERVAGERSVLKTWRKSASGGGEGARVAAGDVVGDGCWEGLSHGHACRLFEFRVSLSLSLSYGRDF